MYHSVSHYITVSLYYSTTLYYSITPYYSTSQCRMDPYDYWACNRPQGLVLRPSLLAASAKAPKFKTTTPHSIHYTVSPNGNFYAPDTSAIPNAVPDHFSTSAYIHPTYVRSHASSHYDKQIKRTYTSSCLSPPSLLPSLFFLLPFRFSLFSLFLSLSSFC